MMSEKASGRWLAVEAEPRTGVVRIATDRLGLAWLYIGRLPAGYIFSSDYAAVAGAMKDGLSIDYDTLVLELALGYTTGEQTLFREIELVPPGAVIELGPAGLVTLHRTSSEYGDRFAGLTREKKYDRLDEIYDAIIEGSIKRLQPALMVSISAGYDSRYALASLHKHSVKPRLATFGHPQSDEVLGAQAVCSKIGLSTSLFRFPEPEWEQWQRCIQLLGNTGMLQWSGWAESWLQFQRLHGRFAVIGYLGDALSGKHLGCVERDEAGWLRFWQDWSTEGGWAESALLRPQARRRLQELLPVRLAGTAGEASFSFPHQQALHLDLFGRQRRWVATQPNLAARFLTPVLFFYDHRLLDFWSNLPVEDLIEQKLYLSYAQSRFPRLFPRGEGQPQSLVVRAIRKAARVAGAAISGRQAVQGPKVISHDDAILPNRQRILDLARRVAPLVEDVIDMGSFCEGVEQYGRAPSLPSAHIMRAVNVFLLLYLAIAGKSISARQAPK
jgi:hypothetical protein